MATQRSLSPAQSARALQGVVIDLIHLLLEEMSEDPSPRRVHLKAMLYKLAPETYAKVTEAEMLLTLEDSDDAP